MHKWFLLGLKRLAHFTQVTRFPMDKDIFVTNNREKISINLH